MTGLARSLSRVAAIARKEFRHLRRDRLTGGMVVGVPLMMTALFGYAINQDVRHLRAGVVDLAGTQSARLLVQEAQATQVIDVVASAESVEALEQLLVAGRISVGIVIPADFERRSATGDRARAQLLVDGGDPIVLGAARGLVSLALADRFASPALAAADSRPRPSRFAPTTTPSGARRCTSFPRSAASSSRSRSCSSPRSRSCASESAATSSS